MAEPRTSVSIEFLRDSAKEHSNGRCQSDILCQFITYQCYSQTEIYGNDVLNIVCSFQFVLHFKISGICFFMQLHVL